MENLEVIGNHALSLIAAISPTALLATLGLMVLGLACASIGWILNNDTNNKYHASKNVKTNEHLALPDMRDASLDRTRIEQPDISLTDSTGSSRSGILDTTLATTVRGIKSLQPGNRKQQSETQDLMRQFEVDLRSTQYKLETREAELREFRSRATTEIKAARTKIKVLESQQSAHKNSKSQILKLTEANNQLRGERDSLKAKVQSNDEALDSKKLELLNKEFQAKNTNLESQLTKQKAEFDDLERANKELLTRVDDLKSAKIDAENAKDEFSKRFAQSQAERDAGAEQLQSNLDDKAKQIDTLEKQIVKLEANAVSLKDNAGKLQDQLQQAEQRQSTTSAELSDSAAQVKSLETELKIGQAQQQSLEESLNEQTKARKLAVDNLASLEEKRVIYREETSREITNLRKQVTQLQTFEVANKNQTTTIRKLEEQISDASRRRIKLEENGAKLAHTTADNERLTQELRAKDESLTEIQTRLNTLESKNASQTQEADKLASQLQTLKSDNNSVQRKNDELRKTVAELEHLRRDSRQQTTRIESLENELKDAANTSAQKDAVTAQLNDSQKQLSDLTESTDTLKTALEKADEKATRYESKSVGLIAEVERGKSDIESITRSRDELNKKVESLEQQLTQDRAKTDQAERKLETIENAHRKAIAERDSQTESKLETIENTHQKAIAERDSQATELNKRIEILNLELDAQQVSYKSLEKQLLNDSSSTKQFESELALKDKQNESFRKQIEDSRLLERQQKERVAKLEMQLTASKARKSEYEDQITAHKQTIESMQATHADALKKETARLNQLLETSEAKATTSIEELNQQKEKIKTSHLEIEALKNKHANELKTSIQENTAKQAEQLQKEHASKLDIAVKEATRKATQEATKQAEHAAQKTSQKALEIKAVEIQKAQKTITDLQTQISAQQTELEKSRFELEGEKKSRAKDADTLATSAAATKQADSKLIALQTKLEKASQELANNKQQVKKLESEHSTYQNDLSTLKATIAERDSAHANADKHKNELSTFKKSVERERESYQKQTQADKDKLTSELTSEKDARNALIEQLKQNDTRKKELNDKLEQATKNLVLRDKSILALQRENEQFESLKGVVAERQADIESLRGQINKLAVLEKKLLEKDELLKKAQSELDSARKSEADQNKQTIALRKSLDDANKSIAQRIQHTESQTLDETEDGNTIELNRLNAQVVSLTNERDLGLQRVKELSEVVKQVKEKDNLIRELRSGITSSKLSDREFDLLRSRIDSQDADLRNKKLTIEELKRQLAQQDTSKRKKSASTKRSKPAKPAYSESEGLELLEGMSDEGTATVAQSKPKAKTTEKKKTKKRPTQNTVVKQTVNNQVSSKSSTRTKSDTNTLEKDDLKSISGIGPKLENQLNAMGIVSFRQIAEFSPSDVSKVSETLAFPGRIERDNWIESAKKLYIEKYKSR